MSALTQRAPPTSQRDQVMSEADALSVAPDLLSLQDAYSVWHRLTD